MAGAGYRDEYEAALRKADALERENAELRARLAHKRGEVDLVPADDGARAIELHGHRPPVNRARMAAAWAVVVGVFTVLYYALGMGR